MHNVSLIKKKLPSVSKILQVRFPMPAFLADNRGYLCRGVLFHAICHGVVMGFTDEQKAAYVEKELAGLGADRKLLTKELEAQAYEKAAPLPAFVNMYGFKTVAAEVGIGSETLGYYGRIDWLAERNGVRYVADFKAGSGVEHARYQMSFYQKLVEEKYGVPARRMEIFPDKKGGMRFKLFDADEDTVDWAVCIDIFNQYKKGVVMEIDIFKKAENDLIVAVKEITAMRSFQEIVIETNEDRVEASEILRDIRGRVKVLTGILDQAKAKHEAEIFRLKEGCEVAYSILRNNEEKVLAGMKSWDAMETARQADELRRAQGEMEKEREKEISALLDANKIAEAKKLAETIVIAVPVPVEKVVGEAKSVVYRAEVINLKMLCAAIVTECVPEAAVKPDMVYLNKRARADKSFLNIPGVKVVTDIQYRMLREKLENAEIENDFA